MGSDKKQIKIATLAVAVIATSICLRAPITGVGSLTAMIREDLTLSGGQAGMITTIPLIVFAVLSIMMGKIASRYGTGRCMFVSLILMCTGMALRSFVGEAGLYTGTVIIGAGIAVGNVLIPGIVKAYFPAKVGLMTGIYATIMSGMGGVSTGISVPAAEKVGWRMALFMWVIVAIAAAITWLPNLRCTTAQQGRGDGRRSIARSGMAWAIVFYFGIQSIVFYCFVAWLPTILQDKGFTPDEAGYMTSLFIVIGIPATFLVPILSEREGNECMLNVIVGILFLIGMVLILLSSDPVVLTIACVSAGLGVGACFSQAMALFGLRTKDAQDAASLSGLSQSVGYIFAAAGPVMAGWLYDITGTWTIALAVMICLAAAETIIGYIVGKEIIINT